jgi:hypothetical protein
MATLSAEMTPKRRTAATKSKPRGRPPKPIDVDELERLGGIQCTCAQAAGWFGLSERQFRKRLTQSEKLGDAWRLGKNKGLATLRENLFELGKRSAPVAIFLAKNYLGMKDDRGLAVTGDLERPVAAKNGYDLSKLSNDQLKALRHLLSLAADPTKVVDESADLGK